MVGCRNIADCGQIISSFDVIGIDLLSEEFFGSDVFHNDGNRLIGGVEVEGDGVVFTVDSEAEGLIIPFFTHFHTKFKIMNDGS